MGLLSNWLGSREGDDEMAGKAAVAIDKTKVAALAGQLKLAVRDAAAFNTLYETITSDKTVTSAELIAVAHQFAGGAKPKSRKAAVTAIGQERQRVAHAKSKTESAAKARGW